MKIVIIDGQGGGMGKNIIGQLTKAFTDIEIIGVGTNSIATSAMLKAGATAAATGENAVIYNCKSADIIIGVIGICFGNSMHGEISPNMAEAITSSDAKKVLIPMTKCNVTVVGVEEKPLAQYMTEVVEIVRQIIEAQWPERKQMH